MHFAKLVATFLRNNKFVQEKEKAISSGKKTGFVKLLRPETVLPISFALLIMLGSLILYLPICSGEGHTLYVDALFTAASAVCVTGLTVVDTGSHWSTIGTAVILMLIQIGGLGIMTFTSFFVLLVTRRLSIMNRDLIGANFSVASAKGNVRNLLLTIVLGTLAVEFLGAALLFLRFKEAYPLGYSIYLALFHSISAFCNAGFSLFSTSLTAFQGDILVNFTVMGLIVIGGIGFWVLYDLRNVPYRKGNFHSTTLHTRVVIYTSLILIGIGAFWFALNEWNNVLAGLPLKNRILASLFQAVTPRTAGFNTVNISDLRDSTLLMMILLMVIGASPGSCGGGIKTSTMAVILAMVVAQINNRGQVQIFKRGIPDHIVSKSIVILFFAIVLLFGVLIALLITERPLQPLFAGRGLFLNLLFESASAFGTVGLSTGVTSFLSSTGKIIVTFLMYMGRVGSATLAVVVAGENAKSIRYAEDDILVG